MTGNANSIWDKDNFFQYKTEFQTYDGDINPANSSPYYTYDTAHIPKIVGKKRERLIIDSSNPNLLVFPNESYVDRYTNDGLGNIYPIYSENYCGYDVSTLCYMHSKALYHHYKNNRIDKDQFWEVNKIESPNFISLNKVIKFFIDELKRILKTSTPYFCTYGEFYWQLYEYAISKH